MAGWLVVWGKIRRMLSRTTALYLLYGTVQSEILSFHGRWLDGAGNQLAGLGYSTQQYIQ